MKRPTILIASAMVVAGTVLVVAFGGVAGSAAPSNPQPDRQSLARHILDPRVKAYMTPATRAAFRTIANGGAELAGAVAALGLSSQNDALEVFPAPILEGGPQGDA